jgi:hypothetical protein
MTRFGEGMKMEGQLMLTGGYVGAVNLWKVSKH